MKKLLGMVALATALIVAQGASAASTSVDFVATQQSFGSSLWTLVASNNTTSGLSAAQFFTNAVSFTADPGIASLLDSGLTGVQSAASISQPESLLSITGAANGTVGIIIVAAGAQNVTLGVITGAPGGTLLTLHDCTDYCGGNAFDPSANPLSYTANVHPAPEPTSLVLLGLGLSGLALVRRRAA